MKYSIPVARMFATARTLIVDVATVVFDTLFFRRRLKRQLQHLYYLNAELKVTNASLAEQINAHERSP